MRKVIGIGETILDIIFRNAAPVSAAVGGSTLNCLVSLSRLGVRTAFISELGGDHVGDLILDYFSKNGLPTDYLVRYCKNPSPVSIAFLSEKADAQYSFYKNYPQERLVDVDLPEISRDDILVIGSYYSVTPALREKHMELLMQARQKGAIVYYDPNFRKPHKSEALRLSPFILENLEYTDIVRGSVDDFQCLFDLSDADVIYSEKIRFYCPNFIYTCGSGDIQLRTLELAKSYSVDRIEPVCTVGAGDNFNAGIIFGLIQYGIGKSELHSLSPGDWDRLIDCGKALSREVCMSMENSIGREFADQFIRSFT